jgi:5'-deoxynucleotidase YfbR-like HD superfamily hydrolase
MTKGRTWLSGDYFITFSGVHIDPTNPRPEDIRLVDIAHNLSMIPRFGGACPSFYSVGSHSMYVADLLPPGLRVEGLLHDASEAYCGDLIKCIKVLCPDYSAVESRFEAAIRARFGLPEVQDPHVKLEIKRADIAALLAERRDVFLDRREYDEIAKAGEPGCVPVKPREGKVRFLQYAAELGIE